MLLIYPIFFKLYTDSCLSLYFLRGLSSLSDNACRFYIPCGPAQVILVKEKWVPRCRASGLSVLPFESLFIFLPLAKAGIWGVPSIVLHSAVGLTVRVSEIITQDSHTQLFLHIFRDLDFCVSQKSFYRKLCQWSWC